MYVNLRIFLAAFIFLSVHVLIDNVPLSEPEETDQSRVFFRFADARDRQGPPPVKERTWCMVLPSFADGKWKFAKKIECQIWPYSKHDNVLRRIKRRRKIRGQERSNVTERSLLSYFKELFTTGNNKSSNGWFVFGLWMICWTIAYSAFLAIVQKVVANWKSISAKTRSFVTKNNQMANDASLYEQNVDPTSKESSFDPQQHGMGHEQISGITDYLVQSECFTGKENLLRSSHIRSTKGDISIVSGKEENMESAQNRIEGPFADTKETVRNSMAGPREVDTRYSLCLDEQMKRKSCLWKGNEGKQEQQQETNDNGFQVVAAGKEQTTSGIQLEPHAPKQADFVDKENQQVLSETADANLGKSHQISDTVGVSETIQETKEYDLRVSNDTCNLEMLSLKKCRDNAEHEPVQHNTDTAKVSENSKDVCGTVMVCRSEAEMVPVDDAGLAMTHKCNEYLEEGALKNDSHDAPLLLVDGSENTSSVCNVMDDNVELSLRHTTNAAKVENEAADERDNKSDEGGTEPSGITREHAVNVVDEITDLQATSTSCIGNVEELSDEESEKKTKKEDFGSPHHVKVQAVADAGFKDCSKTSCESGIGLVSKTHESQRAEENPRRSFEYDIPFIHRKSKAGASSEGNNTLDETFDERFLEKVLGGLVAQCDPQELMNCFKVFKQMRKETHKGNVMAKSSKVTSNSNTSLPASTHMSAKRQQTKDAGLQGVVSSSLNNQILSLLMDMPLRNSSGTNRRIDPLKAMKFWAL